MQPKLDSESLYRGDFVKRDQKSLRNRELRQCPVGEKARNPGQNRVKSRESRGSFGPSTLTIRTTRTTPATTASGMSWRLQSADQLPGSNTRESNTRGGIQMTTPKKTAAIYSRYSSEKQNFRSIADQVTLCKTYAKREGFDVVQEFSDRAKSGATLFERDGVLELMVAAKARKFDAIIVENLDRLSRSPVDLPALFRKLTFLRHRSAHRQRRHDHPNACRLSRHGGCDVSQRPWR